jgi:hypothetical protein
VIEAAEAKLKATLAGEVSGCKIWLADSITWVSDEVAGCVVVSGSHGGTYAAIYGASRGVKAMLLNDAAVGKDGAGVSGLRSAEKLGVAVGALDYLSARIGDASDSYAAGIISDANVWALAAGVTLGMRAAEAASRLAAWTAGPTQPAGPLQERALFLNHTGLTIAILDSASLVEPGMEHVVVVTGSHGGTVGGVALKYRVRAAIFNDAGVGKDRAGIGRLGVLDAMDIPSATVSHRSARIGDGGDTYANGVVSEVNALAASLGIRPGQVLTDSMRALLANG